MSTSPRYTRALIELLDRLAETQNAVLDEVANRCADTVERGGLVHLFGSGHSVIPTIEAFPRYGSFVGFFPLYDPRLMWSNVVGPGGARELLWLERKEGYAEVFLQSYPFEQGDVMIVFSHGGLNAAPIEAAAYAKKKGLTVITVSSLDNARVAQSTHSTCKKLPDHADIAIDNCVPPEDALVDIGRPENVGAGSTMAVIFIAMSLVAETGARLVEKGVMPTTFVSPNVPGIEKDHNQKVFQMFTRALFSRACE